MKALVVDDSKMMRKMLDHFLRELSFETVLAEDGVDGVEKLKASSPLDIVLVDWDMPNMNGLEFVETVRKEEQFKELKILMVTSHNTMDDVVTAMSTGIDDYLMKPVDEVALSEKLKGLGVI